MYVSFFETLQASALYNGWVYREANLFTGSDGITEHKGSARAASSRYYVAGLTQYQDKPIIATAERNAGIGRTQEKDPSVAGSGNEAVTYNAFYFRGWQGTDEVDDEMLSDEEVNDIIEKKIALSRKLISMTKVKYVFGTDRIVHTATDNSLSSYCICKNGKYRHEGPQRFSIYDRIGGGDAFASGVIHGLIKDFNDPQYALKFGLATSILKHTLYGDVSTLSTLEVEEFINTNGDAKVQR